MKNNITVCLLFCYALTYAQQKQQPDTVYATDYLGEVVISANRWEQNLREVPAKITVVNAATIQLQNPQTAADLLGVSNHVFIQKSQLGGGSPMIRGFATNRVLLIVDGVRMNNAIFRGGNVQNVISLDANAIEEAEVIFGPGAVMYGSDAIGGVMDFHTVTPRFGENGKSMIKTNALARYSSANKERTLHADVNIGLRKWAFVSSATRSLYDDLRMGTRGPEEYRLPVFVRRENNADVVITNSNPDVQRNAGYDQTNLMQKISFMPSTGIQLTYGFHYSKTSDYGRFDRLMLLNNEQQPVNAEWYYGPQQWMMNSFSIVVDRAAPLFDRLQFTAAAQVFEESRHNRSFGASRRTDRTEHVDAYSLNVNLDKSLTQTLSLYYGGEFIHNDVASTAQRVNVNNQEITPTSTRYPDGSRWQSSAFYASLKLKPTSSIVVTTSARFTHVLAAATFDRTFFDFPFEKTSLSNSALNGSVGLVYSPSSYWKVYTNLSSGFRAPNIDDIGKVFDSEPGNVVVPNPLLKPELAYNAEVGVSAFLYKRIKVDATVYYTLLDNAIARGLSKFNGADSIVYDGVKSRVQSLQNISDIWIAGIQAGVDVELTKPLHFVATINYQDGKENNPYLQGSHPPPHLAPLFGATHIVYTLAKTKLDVYTNFNGKVPNSRLPIGEQGDRHLYAKDDNGNPYSPSWYTLNLKASHRISNVLTINGGIENLLDKRYRPFASGISAPGRNFIVSIKGTI